VSAKGLRERDTVARKSRNKSIHVFDGLSFTN